MVYSAPQMSGRFSPLSLLTRLAGAAGLALTLAACGPTGPSSVETPLSAPTSPVTATPLGGDTANQIGSGPVRVAMILPLTQNAGPSVVGASLRNAAELAMSEAGSNDITILIKDDRSSAEGARTAAQAALSEGAELFIGPLFAPNVREVGRVAKGANRPVIAFSTDTSTASRGVYLLSFLIESYVDRIIDHAAAKGKKSIAALIPENDYGRVAEAAFQQAAARKGLRVMAVERFAAGGAAGAAQKIASVSAQIDSLFIPEQADAMPAMSQALLANGIDPKRIQILGTGLWNDARVLKLPALQGAWFAAPENAGFNSFAQRYRAKYGTDPTRIATLGYDAVSLVAALARTQGTQRFAESVLTNGSGFNGADGVFRFRPEGQNERGLAVMQINNGNAAAVSPAPRSFTGASGT